MLNLTESPTGGGVSQPAERLASSSMKTRVEFASEGNSNSEESAEGGQLAGVSLSVSRRRCCHVSNHSVRSSVQTGKSSDLGGKPKTLSVDS